MKRLIAEFEQQSFTQIIFPHAKTDWAEYLAEAEITFINIIKAVIKKQKCLVVCADVEYVKSLFTPDDNLHFIEYESDDTWARDCSALSVWDKEDIKLLNFTFNGWGGKFEASKDDAMSRSLSKHYSKEIVDIDFELEGGAIESNGDGLILTTKECMIKRNGQIGSTTSVVQQSEAKATPPMNNQLSGGTTSVVQNSEAKATPPSYDITQRLKNYFGAKEILYLNHGYLAGDDTDSHIDTLARFVDKKTIMYIKCEDKDDEHYKELKLMEDELKVFAKEFGLRLISLPFAHAQYYDNERLPATYANFLFINGGVLVPTYGVKEDKEALEIFKKSFKDRDITPIDCSTLIRQHGSLHCVTMNFAKGVEIL
jgi:agmatine/peptidylarginine deiminase